MNSDVGSIMAACFRVHPVQVYTDRMPQDFVVPSLYFPQPIITDAPSSISSYRVDFSLAVKVFDRTDEQAGDAAERIAQIFRQTRMTIPVIDEDGQNTGQYMRLRRAETRLIDDDVAQLTLTWSSRYQYSRVDYEKMGSLLLNQGIRR
ncbi:phage portal protein [Paenibacillus sp. 11B]|uniref:phage portal protein n=1 Tax=unclassified Paenibacillus TaxID=185978 RepID=UPI00264AD64E|nr:phage portal protein [Paenibacillus sp. 11B]MDN8592026.1 phage portal protein [Paenibacillus sp. 11B]